MASPFRNTVLKSSSGKIKAVNKPMERGIMPSSTEAIHSEKENKPDNSSKYTKSPSISHFSVGTRGGRGGEEEEEKVNSQAAKLYSQRCRDLHQQLIDKESECADAQRNICVLEKRNAQYLEAKEAALAERDRATCSANDALAALRREQIRLFNVQSAAAEREAQLKEQNELLKAQVDHFLCEAHVHMEREAYLETELDHVKQEASNASATCPIPSPTNRNDATAEQLMTLNSQITSFMSKSSMEHGERDQFRQREAELQRKLVELSERLQFEKEERRKMEDRKDRYFDERQSLKVEVEQLRQAAAKFDSRINEAMQEITTSKLALSCAEQRAASLDEQLQLQTEKGADCTRLRCELKNAQSALAACETRAREAQRRCEHFEQELREILVAKERAAAQYEAEGAHLRKSEKSVADKRVADALEKVQTAESRLRALECEVDRLRSPAQRCIKEEQRASAAEQRCTQLEQQALVEKNLRLKIEEKLEITCAELQKVCQEARHVVLAKENLTSCVATLENNVDCLMERSSTQMEQLCMLKEECAEERTEACRLRLAVRSLEEALADERLARQSDADKAAAELLAVRSQWKSSTVDNYRLKEQLHQQRKLIDYLQSGSKQFPSGRQFPLQLHSTTTSRISASEYQALQTPRRRNHQRALSATR